MGGKDDSQSGVDNQIRFRADDTLLAQIRKRMSRRSNATNAIAKRDLERYYNILDASLPKFPLDEAGLILDALAYERVQDEFSHLLWAVVVEADEKRGLSRLWGVDGKKVSDTLRGLHPIGKLAVLDAFERAKLDFFGMLQSKDDEESRNVCREVARRVGLVAD